MPAQQALVHPQVLLHCTEITETDNRESGSLHTSEKSQANFMQEPEPA
jgi:hypothetical protein